MRGGWLLKSRNQVIKGIMKKVNEQQLKPHESNKIEVIIQMKERLKSVIKRQDNSRLLNILQQSMIEIFTLTFSI